MTDWSAQPPVRRVALVIHILIAAPGMLLIGVAVLAILLSLVGSNGDPHGFATFIALVLGGIAAVPVVAYLWLVRRWWLERGWLALAVADVGVFAIAAWLLIANYSPGEPWVAAVYGGVATLGAILVVGGAGQARPGD